MHHSFFRGGDVDDRRDNTCDFTINDNGFNGELTPDIFTSDLKNSRFKGTNIEFFKLFITACKHFSIFWVDEGGGKSIEIFFEVQAIKLLQSSEDHEGL